MALFQFLFDWPPFLSIFVISFVITLAVTLVYKYTTDQKRMRELRDKVKAYQEKMKKARDNPEKMLKLQQEAMGYNLELMKHSLKPTLYTFLPVIIIFAFLNAHMGYHNIAPGQEFAITATAAEGVSGNATLAITPAEGISIAGDASQPIVSTGKGGSANWTLKGDAGTYKATLSLGGQSVEKQFKISGVRGDYVAPQQGYKGAIARVEIGNRPIHPFGESFSIFGWHPGWLATYIFLSIALSLAIRKALNVV